MYRAWVEINLNAIEGNYNLIKNQVDNSCEICCVVKANAYGHGAVKITEFYEKIGVKWFAVATFEEALNLRKNGVKGKILILGYTPVKHVKLLCQNNFCQCVYSLEYAEALNKKAEEENVVVNAHIKVDTGMGRLGFKYLDLRNNELNQICSICKKKNLIVTGVFTHFALSDIGWAGKDYTKNQFDKFQKVLSSLKKNNINFQLKHCANSGALVDYPSMNMDMVRAGLILYGINPSKSLKQLPLTKAMSLKSVVSQVKVLEKGQSVSYGRRFIAQRRMKVATVSIGYADGLWRSNSGKIKLCINGAKVDILGAICMDQLIVDVSRLNNVKIGDEVVVFGEQPYTTVEEIAKANGTIPYEIFCSIGNRVPRIYVYNGRVTFVQDN